MSGSAPPDGKPGAGPAADPSMEDILASIRRILNEDEAAAPAHPEPPPHAQPSAPGPAPANAGGSGGESDDGVLVLDEAMLVQPPAEPPVAGHDAPVLPQAEEPRAAPAMPDLPPAPPVATVPPSAVSAPEPSPLVPGGGLLAPESAAAAASSVGSLLRTLSEGRSTQVRSGGPTIEDLVREELRPLLKAWLDQHLPPLVERTVRQEIERVTGRATP